MQLVAVINFTQCWLPSPILCHFSTCTCLMSHTSAQLHRFSAVATSRKKGSRARSPGRPHAEPTSMTSPLHHADQIWHAAIQQEGFLLPLSPFSARKQLTVSHPAPPRPSAHLPHKAVLHVNSTPPCPPGLLSHISGPLRA